MNAYNDFNKTLQYDYKFISGNIYELDDIIKIYPYGFNFCQVPISIFDFYNSEYNNFIDVEILENINRDYNKNVTNNIKIKKIISKKELLQKCNCKNNNNNNNYDLQEIYININQFWYNDHKLHRDNDLPIIIFKNGNCEWYQKDILHNNVYNKVEQFNIKTWYQLEMFYVIIFFIIYMFI